MVVLGLAAVAANYLVPGLFSDKPALARLELETGDADLQVLVVQDGKTVAVLDAKKQATLELPPGTYDLHLGGEEKDRKLSADRVTLAAGGKHILWAVGLVRTMVGHRGFEGVWGVAISPDGSWAVSCGVDTCVRKWDLATGRQLWERKFDFQYGEFSNFLRSVAVSPDGKLALVAAYIPPVAILLDTQTGAELRRFEGHKAFVQSVSFSKDGLFALTAAGTWFGDQEPDNTARLWEVARRSRSSRAMPSERLDCGIRRRPSASSRRPSSRRTAKRSSRQVVISQRGSGARNLAWNLAALTGANLYVSIICNLSVFLI